MERKPVDRAAPGIVAFLVKRGRTVVVLSFVLAFLASIFVGVIERDLRSKDRLGNLQIEAGRGGLEILSRTLGSSIVGGISLLGLVDEDLRRVTLRAAGEGSPESQRLVGLFQALGKSENMQGIFAVRGDGIVATSWDDSGKPSTGLDVSFRPYFKIAMDGKPNVYAAVSMARGDRSLYFAAPIRPDRNAHAGAIGAIVARSGLEVLDKVLHARERRALILSPQGVVFASSDDADVGKVGRALSPSELAALRSLKQFGAKFENSIPEALPYTVEPGTHLIGGRRWGVASSDVEWGDPFGPWKLVLYEDFTSTVSPLRTVGVVLFAFVVICAFLLVLIALVRSSGRQAAALRDLEALSRAERAAAARQQALVDGLPELQSASDEIEIGKVFFRRLHAMADAAQGALYLGDGMSSARLAGGWACATPPPDSLAPGEGLLGQCLAERKFLSVETWPEGFASVRSGLGSARPKRFLFVPLVVGSRVFGAVEIAFLDDPDEGRLAQTTEWCRLLSFTLASNPAQFSLHR